MKKPALVAPSDGNSEVREDMSLQTQPDNLPPPPPPARKKPAMYELVKLAELERINNENSDGADPPNDGMKLSIVFIRSTSMIHL